MDRDGHGRPANPIAIDHDKRNGDQREVVCVGSLTCNQSATDGGRKLNG
jgi:hypothetical protein